MMTTRQDSGITSLDYASIDSPQPTPSEDSARALRSLTIVLSMVVVVPLLCGILAAVVALVIW